MNYGTALFKYSKCFQYSTELTLLALQSSSRTYQISPSVILLTLLTITHFLSHSAPATYARFLTVPHTLQAVSVLKPLHCLFPLSRMFYQQIPQSSCLHFLQLFPPMSVENDLEYSFPPNLPYLALFYLLCHIYYFLECYAIMIFYILFLFTKI